MKLQAKVMLIMVATWLGICIIAFAYSKFVIADNYQSLEKQVIQYRVQDTQRAFDRMLDSLVMYVSAWAQWDDTYDFMKVKNTKFIKSNFIPATYKNAQLNFIMFFDNKGRLYYGKAYNAGINQLVPIPQSLLDSLRVYKSFLFHRNINSNHVGILSTELGLIILNSKPIIRSTGQPPIRGSLVMGYFLNSQFFNTLSELIGMKVTFFSLASIARDKLLADTYANLVSEKYFPGVVNNPKIEYGFLLLKDINANPIGLLRIDIPRGVYQQGVLTSYQYLTIVLLSGMIFIWLMWFLLKRLVLDRVLSISKQILEINHDNHYNQHILVSGCDELSNMVFTINKMLSMISDSQKQLGYLASHDVLTNLPNRKYFYDLLNQAITRVKATNNKIAVMFLDMDKLKAVNDSYGHSVGDKLIIEAAERIKQSLRKTDVVGRQSGDEFILFLQDTVDMNTAADTAKRILQKTSKPFMIDGHAITVTFSIGISIYPDDGITIEKLISHADMVMYLSKIQAGNNYQFYSNTSGRDKD